MVAGLAAAVLALGACASQGGNSMSANQKASQQKKVAKQGQAICVQQTTLGSHIARTTCITEQQYKQLQKEHAKERTQTQQQLQQMGSNGQCTAQDGGCIGPGGGPPGGRR
jgi:hypothetical protein